MKNSRTWNCAGLAGETKAGRPGAGPRPVMVKLCTGEKGESSAKTTPPTICVSMTRQKYVPFGSPLSMASVRVGMVGSPDALVNPDATIVAKVDVFDTCQGTLPIGPEGT